VAVTGAAARPSTPGEVDVVVVGSGFGGSVAALRLAEKGYDVTVYEAGRRFEDDDFATTSWDTRRFLWAPRLGCFGIQRIHKLPDLLVLAGAGVGGGSLVYANTLYVPPAPFFTDPQWGGITDWQAELAPYYDQARRMLGVVEHNPCQGAAESLMLDTARAMGVEQTYRKTPVGVFFGRDGRLEPGVEVDDPFFGGAGPRRTGCTQCGACMTGCRVGAKNTLVKNYLALAERLGVRIEPLRTVVDLRPVDPDRPEAGYRVTTERTGAWRDKDRRTVLAREVVVAAGAWGTQQLLHRMKAGGALPRLSRRLGELTRTNSEALLGVQTERAPKPAEGDLTRGVAITASFHPDAETHIENVRYGKGSSAMGLLAAILVDGRPGGRKRPWWRFFVNAARHPLVLGRSLSVYRWPERTIIALVMQTRDNSLTTTLRQRRLLPGWRMVSRQGHGEPNPRWIEPGHRAVRELAAATTAETGLRAFPGGSWLDIGNVPMTAHYLGGCPIGADAEQGVVDPYLRLYGHPGLHVVDGAAVSANLGVNPSLTITAQAERAFALWPNKGEADPRPEPGAAYRPVEPVPPQRPAVPEHAPGALRLLPRGRMVR
jgi:cholesterol oxidase